MRPIEFRVLKVVRETLGEAGAQIDLDTRAQDVKEWDSVGQVKLFLALENEFDLSFGPDELAEIASVRDIVQLLETHGV